MEMFIKNPLFLRFMRGLINAYGKKDSLNQDRVSEIRGLIQFGGRPVIIHTLDKLLEIGVNPILLLVNQEHRLAYEQALRDTRYPIEVCDYNGYSNPMLVYLEGLRRLQGDNVLIVADDNLFDFGLQGLLHKFHEVDDNTLVVRNPASLDIKEDLNLGRCQIDSRGKVVSASYSFAPDTYVDKGLVICDIYLVHQKRIQGFLDFLNQATLQDAEREWFRDFYAWEARDGFWADIGKEPLRKKAEKRFESIF